MDQRGPVRVTDVSDAQSAIVELAKDLAARAEIVIARKSGEDDELIY